MQQQTDQTALYEYMQALDMLYRHEILGDCFVDLITPLQDVAIQKKMQHTIFPTQTTPQRQINPTQDILHTLTQKIAQCRLCALAKMVQNSQRFYGIIPTQQTFMDIQQTKSLKCFPNIAFIVESLRLKDIAHDGYNTIQNLEANRTNDMLFDIIQKVFLLHRESVFILSLFKCAEVGDNQNISMQIRTQSLATERRTCSTYLRAQLECVSYAIFFGEQMCFDFFEITLQEASGKLLEYYTPNDKKVVCVCVPDIMQMLMKPKLKKDAFINFVLLKNAIYANSC